jgi:hypothetical protein
MDEMINALTRGIGPEQYRPIRISYNELKKVLFKDPIFNNCTDDIKQFLLDVLALSIFNQHVILPLHGASNFISGAREHGAKRVKMAGYVLDSNFYNETDKITKMFFAITNKYGLPIEKLYVSSLNKFIENWLAVVRNNGN